MKLKKMIEQLETLSYAIDDRLNMATNASDRADYRKDIKALDSAISILNTLKELAK